MADEPFRVEVKDASSENGQRINRAKRHLGMEMANTKYYGTIPPAPFQKARPPSSAQILRAASMTPV